MPTITSYKFDPTDFSGYKKSHYLKDWPVVYLLENGTDMYVGETVNAISRIKSHYRNPARQALEKAHVITDEEYNKSATLDIESWLIQYIAADEKYILQNGNAGLTNHSYYDREKYKAKFELIWEELQRMGLAKNDLVQIKNSDIFKYSPYKSLTGEQVEIVETISESLEQENHLTHIINGEPGTGKSVLATYLAKFLVESDKTNHIELALVIPMTGLRDTLKKVFRSIKGLSPKMVIGPTEVTKKNYDLLIVDEAHRLRRRVNLSSYGPYDKANRHFGLDNNGSQLDWIVKSSKSQVLLYDDNQSIVPGDIRPESISKLSAKHYSLTSQLRVLAGSDYLNFIDDLLNVKVISKPKFKNYDLRYFDNVRDMLNKIQTKNEQHGLARMVAGYAWTWESKKDTEQDYDIELDGLRLKWNSTNKDWVNSINAVNEVGCIHTVQGYDLNYVGVIIGPELYYDTAYKKLRVDKKKYMDFNGKRSIESDEELERYIINIYKTLLSRGIQGTYIHAVDKNLALYLSQIIVD